MPNNNFKIDKVKLVKDIDKNIIFFRRISQNDKKKTTWIEVYKATAAAIATALLGIGQLKLFGITDDNYFQALAILITASLSIVTAWDALFRHKDLWIMHADARNKLVKIKQEITHAENTNTLSDELLSNFFNEYQDVWSNRNKNWFKIRESDG
ncbi:hypothetical protein LP7551_02048 [Roseibium album]|nr:hypothetical protein LP7551_02048 [Roseibium album]